MKTTQSTFWVLKLPNKQKKVKNSADLAESLLNLHGLESSELAANPGKR